jgi:hypothetical protein
VTVYYGGMKDFVETHQSKIRGVLSCFDRMLFRGYLPLRCGSQMAGFLNQPHIRFHRLKDFLTEHSLRLKLCAQEMAQREGRPYVYLNQKRPMEREARALAEKDGIDKGLVCIFSILEPCRTFSFKFLKDQTFARSAQRKCLHLYYYFMEPDFGLIHVKVQTWFPMTMQVYVNGQEWLARKLQANGIGFAMLDNVFIEVEDLERAQAFADRLPSLDWPRILTNLTRRTNPLMDELLKGLDYYWVTAQSEYATDVLFKSRQALQELYPRILSHGMLCFGAKEVMGFLGKKLHGNFQGEVVTDMTAMEHRRIPGMRIKHRVKKNWLKMYDKAGIVLRVETVINSPEEFRVRRRVRRGGQAKTEWVQMLKGVSYLFRYRDVSRSANSRYLDSLAVVSDHSAKVRELERITRRKRVTPHRTAKALNPLSREDLQLFEAVMNGAHCVRGFMNRDIRDQLRCTTHFRGLREDDRRRSAKVTRIFQRLHAHGLIAKIPHSRKWRTTRFGRRVMAAAILVKNRTYPELLERSA